MPIASLGSPHHGEGEMRGRRRIRAARAAERRREGREILTEFESASNIRTIQHGTFFVEGLPVFVTHCNTDFSFSLDNHTDNRYHADVPQFG